MTTYDFYDIIHPPSTSVSRPIFSSHHNPGIQHPTSTLATLSVASLLVSAMCNFLVNFHFTPSLKSKGTNNRNYMPMYTLRRPLQAIVIICLISLPICKCFALNNARSPLSTTYSSKIPIRIRGGDSSSATFSSAEAKSDIDSTPPPQPTLKELYNFYLPCLGLWISGPLLSLVDTASVGLTAQPGRGAIELGALGPATTFIDGSTYLFAFLNVATTNLYASALARNAGNEEKAKLATDAVVRTAAKIALICGVGIMSLLFWKGEFLLSLYVGDGGKEIIESATKYVHIRALSMPTSLVFGVLQAALLGAKDSVSPLVAVLASTITNVVGDTLLVVLLKWGVAGAAIATTIAQWAGTAAMVGPTKEKLLTESTKELKAENKVSSPVFLSFAAPVLTLILGKLAAFGMLTHVAAALPGEAALASHQVSKHLGHFSSSNSGIFNIYIFLTQMVVCCRSFFPCFSS